MCIHREHGIDKMGTPAENRAQPGGYDGISLVMLRASHSDFMAPEMLEKKTQRNLQKTSKSIE